jgi:hypothetical protein
MSFVAKQSFLLWKQRIRIHKQWVVAQQRLISAPNSQQCNQLAAPIRRPTALGTLSTTLQLVAKGLNPTTLEQPLPSKQVLMSQKNSNPLSLSKITVLCLLSISKRLS